ncbi:hypothetical protein BKA56DRAFT_550966 [Ilyonectria sp. MPI-CAGE-AT-0026]|nr:hypothetical protein BKA56DRAFT_550966 [Ilyonectria sp. MPI-CAGE-AT-0026]
MDEGTSSSQQGAIPPTGMTVVFIPSGQAELDIVFIHGFKGHPERTWSYKNSEPTETHRRTRRPNLLSRLSREKESADNSSIFWPQSLLPFAVPSARVLTYGYDTHIQHRTGPPVSTHTIYDIACDFLIALEAERREEPLRPVLFIAHSFGGIVLKEMLRRSHDCYSTQSHLYGVFESTIGMIFFGTPHAGADPRGLVLSIAEKAIRAAGYTVNEHVINALLPSSERLKEMRDVFGPMAQERNWIIHSFQEQYRAQGLLGKKVVEDSSSCLNIPSIETTEHISRNHMTMARFTGIHDPEFKKVAAALRRITSVVLGPRIQKGKSTQKDNLKQILMKSLIFDKIDARHMIITNAHGKTCQWVLQQPEYLSWLDPSQLDQHRGFLWVKGNPGAGKSTLMKLALADAKKSMQDKTIISFFFNARGQDLEKSTLGMYRSLIHQLLTQLPALQRISESLQLTNWNGESYEWRIEPLKELFEQAIKSLGESSVVCFIDALDECDERQIRDMMSFFEHVGELAVSTDLKFHVCFSSRHYPHITMQHGLSLVLDGQEGHSQDITQYLDSKLKIGQSKLAQKIRSELQTKAHGSFIWVVLVVEILNKEHDGGRMQELQQRLQDIPSDLHDLFQDILERDQRRQDELLISIQWVLFARVPLTPAELHLAIVSNTHPGAISTWDTEDISTDDIGRFILDCSKGLIEVVGSVTPIVQFIHESVRDFFLKENEFDTWPHLGENLVGQSHDVLKQGCLNLINNLDICACLDPDVNLSVSQPPPSRFFRWPPAVRFPLLAYAVRNVFYHADTAGRCGIAQQEFIQRFEVPRWAKLYNIIKSQGEYRYSPRATLLYILAEANTPHLIEIHPCPLSCIEKEGEGEERRYGCPLFVALATGNNAVLQTFRNSLLLSLPPDSAIRTQRSQKCQYRSNQPYLPPHFMFLRGRSILSHMVECKDEELFAVLLETGKLFVDSTDNFGRTPLSYAVVWSARIVRLLLETGRVDIDSRANNGRTPLSWAASNNSKTAIQLLLDTGRTGTVDVESEDNNGRTPLSWAAARGDEAVVKLLLETGKVDIGSEDNEGNNPFWWATTSRNVPAQRLLSRRLRMKI